MLGVQFIEQFLGFFQIARVEPFRKPPRKPEPAVRAVAGRTRERVGLSCLLLRARDAIKLGLFDDCGRRLTGQLGPCAR